MITCNWLCLLYYVHVFTLMFMLLSTRLIGDVGMRKHIMEMTDLVTQLKSLQVEISEPFMVHLILNSLSSQYGPFRYHTTHIKRNGQSMNFWPCVSRRKEDLLNKLVKVLLAWLKIRGRRKKEEKNHIPPIAKIKESRYFFSVKRKGTWWRIAINIRLGLGTRVVIFPFVCFESNMADIFHDTCFIDSRSTIHISNTM